MNRSRASGGSGRHGIPEEETQCWSQAAEHLEEFVGLRNDKSDRELVLQVNRMISELPESIDQTNDPATLYNVLNPVRPAFVSQTEALRNHAEKEVAAINAALEKISILIALRRSSEVPLTDKRNKRMRPNSPSRDGTPQTAGSGSGGTGAGAGAGPGSGTRGSAAPSSGSGTAAPATSSRTGKISSAASRRDRDRDRDGGERGGAVQALEINRKVAFKAPPKKDPDTGRMEAAQWILATVKAFIPPKSYEVEDADEESDATYTALGSALVPLPLPDGSPGSGNAPEYSAGQRVLAVYPGTTVFYNTTVVDGPRKYVPSGGSRTVSTKTEKSYKVKFDEDEDNIRVVPAHLVFVPPGHGHGHH